MREIKFREWDGARFHCWGFNISSAWFTGPTNRGNATQEQFTGLHDKNGKEIYEGDIVDSLDGYGYCRRTIIGFDAEIDCDGMESACSGWFVPYAEKLEFEVIGNIHENPELIGG